MSYINTKYVPYDLIIIQVQFGMKGEKNVFPIGNYLYFTERQFNWCNLLI